MQNKGPGLLYFPKLLQSETPYLELTIPAEYLNMTTFFNPQKMNSILLLCSVSLSNKNLLLTTLTGINSMF
jgi:hypothetical protein